MPLPGWLYRNTSLCSDNRSNSIHTACSCGPNANSPLNCSVSDCQSQCGSNTICTGILTQPEVFSACTCQAGYTSTNGHDCTTASPSASTGTSDVDKYVAAIVTIAVVMLVVILIFAIITFQRTKGKVAASHELTVGFSAPCLPYYKTLTARVQEVDRHNAAAYVSEHPNRPLVDSSI